MTNFENQPNEELWLKRKQPFLIAEIGGNHEGNFAVARELLESAISSGVNCVKFQIYEAKSLVNGLINKGRFDHFKRFELKKSQHIELAKIARSKGVIYNSSVWSIDLLNWIDHYLDFYKIGSGDLTAYPIIKELVKRRKPIILSTGLSSLKEVLETVSFIQKLDEVYCKPEMMCLLQCTSMYPIPLSEANLNVMSDLRERTGLSIGYSDHTEGIDALKIASVMGANVLEFHYTDKRENKLFRDHKVSLVKEEVIELVEFNNKVNLVKGSSLKEIQKIELDNGHDISFRRAVYPNKKIKKGDIISESDLICLRPLVGTDARNYDSVIGVKAKKDLEPFQSITKSIDY